FKSRVPSRCRDLSLIPSFFEGPADPRALPSFPTRRSSDLRNRSTSRRLPREARKTRSSSISVSPRAQNSHCWKMPASSVPQDPQDRKSTRLNSSHVKISYAVFCLKKKKKQTTTGHEAHPAE